MRTLFGFLAATVGFPLTAAEDGLHGRLLEKVTCVADATQSYALYVPSNYSPDKKWPVIFCFDPGARGRTPVERLQTAGEQFGYIVAGSNNSRNGPWEGNAKAIRAMVGDVQSRLAIDARRVYAAGLSGGARVAIQTALLGMAKGVIACSAGFPDPEIPLRVSFPVFGTAGIEDISYGEMMNLDRQLEDRKALYRIVVFGGGHEWAPAALLTDAVEWLDLQAMRAGTRPRDETRIRAAWEKRVAAMPSRPGLERWRGLKSLAADFKGLTETAEIEEEAKKVGLAVDVKEGLKAERALTARERELGEKVVGAIDASAAKKHAVADDLIKRAEAPDDSPDRQIARRVRASYAAMVRERLRGMFADEEYSEAANMLEMAAILRPGQTRTLFDLARARAYQRDPKRALQALGEAADAGFSDAERAESEPAFAKLKSDPVFRERLAAIRANPPEPERAGGGGRRFP
ncbi:MAG: hypothetical protein ABIZ49_11230 [Opitutaceae bacterium]